VAPQGATHPVLGQLRRGREDGEPSPRGEGGTYQRTDQLDAEQPQEPGVASGSGVASPAQPLSTLTPEMRAQPQGGSSRHRMPPTAHVRRELEGAMAEAQTTQMNETGVAPSTVPPVSLASCSTGYAQPQVRSRLNPRQRARARACDMRSPRPRGSTDREKRWGEGQGWHRTTVPPVAQITRSPRAGRSNRPGCLATMSRAREERLLRCPPTPLAGEGYRATESGEGARDGTAHGATRDTECERTARAHVARWTRLRWRERDWGRRRTGCSVRNGASGRSQRLPATAWRTPRQGGAIGEQRPELGHYAR
jgi:hypothetical protein